MISKYEMPQIGLESVYWFASPGSEPAAAVVTVVGRNAVSVMIFPPESRVGVPKDGCRHVSDPGLAAMVQHDGGCWDYTPMHKLILGIPVD